MKKVNMSQVFLKDLNMRKKICNTLKNDELINKVKNIIEVGVGKGEMTQVLIDAFPNKNYLGIEIDKAFTSYTKRNFNVFVKNEDYFVSNVKNDEKCLLYSSIPYHLTTKFIKKFLLNLKDIRIIILAFIIQKETFYRLLSDNKYVFYAFRDFFELKKQITIKRQCFKPMPNVESIFSVWHIKTNKFLNNTWEYLECIKTFNHRRNKNIINNLKDTNQLELDKILNENLKNKKFLQLNNLEKNQLIDIGIKFFKERSKN